MNRGVMASFVWTRDPDEAYENPYEYDAQDQFVREAKAVLDGLRVKLNEYDMTYKLTDVSIEKAIWLLHTDTLCSLGDGLGALEQKKHRPAARVFRDVVETMDLAVYFSSESNKSNRALTKWYSNEIVPHSEYRDYIKSVEGVDVAKGLAREYKSLSKFTHRSYRAITASCGLGGGDLIWHENHSNFDIPMLVQPIAAYCAVLAGFVLKFCSEVASRGLLEQADVEKLIRDCMEDTPVKRRFMVNGGWREDGGT